MKKTTYFKVHHPDLIGKEENDQYYVYVDKKWIPDNDAIILGKLIGYDPFEPDDSPYKTGNTSVMDEIEVISEEEMLSEIEENIDPLQFKGTGKDMLSRVYVYDNRHYGKDPTIEYYDYDEIDKDGSSKAYIFTIPGAVFEREASIITRNGRDGDLVLSDIFADYEGWKDLKQYFDNNDIEYRYEEISLSKEERYQKQSEQFGEHRCAAIHNMMPFDELKSLNEYEYNYAKSLIYDRNVIYEIPFDWEEDDFVFLKQPIDLEEEEALAIMHNNYPTGLHKAEDCPEEIRELLDKWNRAGNEVEINWPAKQADFRFVFKRKYYVLYPEAMRLDDTRVDHISHIIEDDLKRIGCKRICCTGMLD